MKGKVMKKNYHITPKNNGWQVKGEKNTKANKLFYTQKEAIDYAKELAQKSEGNVIIHGKNGRIRDNSGVRKTTSSTTTSTKTKKTRTRTNKKVTASEKEMKTQTRVITTREEKEAEKNKQRELKRQKKEMRAQKREEKRIQKELRKNK